MSPSDLNIEHHAGSFWHRIVAAVTRIGRAGRQRAVTRRAERQLSQMSDRMLADIGIARGQIPNAVIHGKPADDQPVNYWSR